MEQDSHSDQEILDILSLRKIAVIGMSQHPSKAAHYVPKYLSEHGYDITPINPSSDEILHKKCYPSISDVSESFDVIEIFRPSEDVLSFVKDAIKKKPKVIWLQEGIHNTEAEELAKKEGSSGKFKKN